MLDMRWRLIVCVSVTVNECVQSNILLMRRRRQTHLTKLCAQDFPELLSEYTIDDKVGGTVQNFHHIADFLDEEFRRHAFLISIHPDDLYNTCREVA